MSRGGRDPDRSGASGSDHKTERGLAACDARLAWLLGPTPAPKTAFAGSVLTLMIAFSFIGKGVWETISGRTDVVQVDLIVFWAVAKLGAVGEVAAALDIERLHGAMGIVPENWLPFAYPPGFLLAILPLGVLPFGAAWARSGSGLRAWLDRWRSYDHNRDPQTRLSTPGARRFGSAALDFICHCGAWRRYENTRVRSQRPLPR